MLPRFIDKGLLYLIVFGVAASIATLAWLHITNKYYDLGYEAAKAEYETKLAEETLKQTEAARVATENLRMRLIETEFSNAELRRTLEEVTNDVETSSTGNNPSLSVGSVRQLNRLN